MSAQRALIVMAAAGLLCYALRLLPAMLVARAARPAWLERALGHVAPAAFAALAATALAASAGDGAARIIPRLLAVGVAALVARRTRSVIAAIGCGVAVLWLASAAA